MTRVGAIGEIRLNSTRVAEGSKRSRSCRRRDGGRSARGKEEERALRRLKINLAAITATQIVLCVPEGLARFAAFSRFDTGIDEDRSA